MIMDNNFLQSNKGKHLLSIIVPVYFNEKSLPLLYEEFCNLEVQLAKKNINIELIFIDDGSEDNSLNELLNLKIKNSTIKDY